MLLLPSQTAGKKKERKVESLARLIIIIICKIIIIIIIFLIIYNNNNCSSSGGGGVVKIGAIGVFVVKIQRLKTCLKEIQTFDNPFFSLGAQYTVSPCTSKIAGYSSIA